MSSSFMALFIIQTMYIQRTFKFYDVIQSLYYYQRYDKELIIYLGYPWEIVSQIIFKKMRVFINHKHINIYI